MVFSKPRMKRSPTPQVYVNRDLYWTITKFGGVWRNFGLHHVKAHISENKSMKTVAATRCPHENKINLKSENRQFRPHFEVLVRARRATYCAFSVLAYLYEWKRTDIHTISLAQSVAVSPNLR